MAWGNRAVRAALRVYLEIVRIVPQMVLLFIAFFGLPRLWGVYLPAEAVAILVFSFWATAEMGDLVRGALASMPRHQTLSALALGLRRWQVFRFVLIPQAARRLLPPAINLVTRVVKTTALISLIGMADVLKVGKQIIDFNRFQYTRGAFWIYGAIFLLYFFICYPVSRFSKKLEERWKDS
jgi:polar amino acid transport system permease protein